MPVPCCFDYWSMRYSLKSGNKIVLGVHRILSRLQPWDQPFSKESGGRGDPPQPRAHLHTLAMCAYVHACSVSKLCPPLCDPMACSPPGSSAHGILQARILEGGCHFLLQGIFLTQGSNPHLYWQVHSFITEPPVKPTLLLICQQFMVLAVLHPGSFSRLC